MKTNILPFLAVSVFLSVGCGDSGGGSGSSNDGGSGGDGAGGSSAGGGGAGAGTTATTGGGAYGPGCDGLCDKVADAGCANDTKASCLTECDALYTQAPNCTADIDALVACQISAGEVVCEGGDAKTNGCDTEGNAFFTCLTGGGGGGGECYANAGDCNPLTDSCPAGNACDIADDGLLHCFPPPNNAPIGGACDVSAGPFCAHGGTCVENVCRSFCCSDNDCAAGSCQELGGGAGTTISACL